MHITTATREQLERAIEETPELKAIFEASAPGARVLADMGTEEIRERITTWIEEGDETHESIHAN